jgi:hypothetical protein
MQPSELLSRVYESVFSLMLCRNWTKHVILIHFVPLSLVPLYDLFCLKCRFSFVAGKWLFAFWRPTPVSNTK